MIPTMFSEYCKLVCLRVSKIEGIFEKCFGAIGEGKPQTCIAEVRCFWRFMIVAKAYSNMFNEAVAPFLRKLI